MPRKQATTIKNCSLIISMQHQGRQEDGFMHTRTHMHDNRCYSCNLKEHYETRRSFEREEKNGGRKPKSNKIIDLCCDSP